MAKTDSPRDDDTPCAGQGSDGRDGPLAHRKPLLTAERQVAHLKARGVTFDLMDEAEAAAYLRDANNYLRVASYRSLYPRQVEGPRIGQYVSLDFGALVALASLDRRLREAFLAAAIDVEHFAKVKVLREAERRGEDGYAIVADFMASLAHAERNRLVGGLRMRAREGERRDTYLGDLIAHYLDNMPAWVFLEAVEFGAFANFYLFCSLRWDDETMRQEHYVLKSVKALRNAAAHNTCIVNGLAADAPSAGYRTNRLITDSLNAAGMGRTRTRRAKLSNLRVSQMAATLYALQALCTRPSTLARHTGRFASLRGRYEATLPTLQSNVEIKSFFAFLWRLVDIWLPAG